MGLIQKITRFAYDAAARTGRRKTRPVDRRSEDGVLRRPDRDKLTSDVRDLRRNSSPAAWALRKHIDHVATLHCQFKTGCDKLDDQLTKLMNNWQQAENCDNAGRHSFRRLLRLIESCRIQDGDVFVVRYSNGKIALIEADRIRSPDAVDSGAFVHGIQTTKGGKALRYAVHTRDVTTGGFTFDSYQQAQYIWQLGYYSRPDQIRGVSPILTALNQFTDLYEAQEYTLAKMKLTQLIGLKITREAADEDTEIESGGDGEGDGEGCEEKPGYKFNFSGPQVMDMDPGDNAEFIESKTPSTEFQSFMTTGLQMALQGAFDIPLCFYDPTQTNYSSYRAALLDYEKSAKEKRADLIDFCMSLTRWLISIWIMDGLLELPDGWTVDDVAFEWIGGALPWIDPKKEADAKVTLLDNNLACHEDLCRENGTDWYETMAKRAREKKYLEKLGLSEAVAKPAAPGDPAQTYPSDEEGTDDGQRQAA